MFRHLCSKNKAFLPCLSGQVLDFSIFYTHKYKIFLLITFFKIFRNDWAHTGNIYWNFAKKWQWAQSFLNILKKVINKKILYLCVENMLKSSFYSVAFNFFGPCLVDIPELKNLVTFRHISYFFTDIMNSFYDFFMVYSQTKST